MRGYKDNMYNEIFLYDYLNVFLSFFMYEHDTRADRLLRREDCLLYFTLTFTDILVSLIQFTLFSKFYLFP